MNAPAHSWTAELASAIRVGDPRWVAAAGRVVLVWVPCYTLMGYRFGPSPTALVASTILAAVWLVSLRSAFAAVHFTLGPAVRTAVGARSEEHTSELQSLTNLVCRLLLEKKKTTPLVSSISKKQTKKYSK